MGHVHDGVLVGLAWRTTRARGTHCPVRSKGKPAAANFLTTYTVVLCMQTTGSTITVPESIELRCKIAVQYADSAGTISFMS